MTMVPFAKRATEARNVVVLTGAGVSVAGLKPYRGPGGLGRRTLSLLSRPAAGVHADTLWTVTCDWRKELAKAEPNARVHTVLLNLEAPDSVPFAKVIRGEAQTLVPELFS